MKCDACNKPETETNKLQKCSVCHASTYCSRECQKSDFAAHKPACKKKGVLALLTAIRDNNEAEVRRLMKTKYVLNGKVDYTLTDQEDADELAEWTPLHECIRMGRSDLLRILVKGPGVKLEIKDGDGETPVFLGATSTDPLPLRVLLEAGANPNTMARDGWTALMVAVRDGSYENTEALLEAGGDVNAGRDMFGRTCLDFAESMATGQTGIRMKGDETREKAEERYRRILALLLSYQQ
mmetsp:Transcript_17953/g.39265  ORF Transcript_17953/g.39265 Transcript_17953/m.39265 type:complete len:239 (+) Transcript_17953:310-1026(+)|eukprot:CAMPEP_0178520834 /NCGR_PEP_ID=MMETSP0696-20121128/27621_1 /TAXON_ID=265572 /ORGANISM="Extubocellulus spinifer, Strain CCMP396" /LENGTH=238 /DNA_ID=CAMNT_0020151729 /DNA_START=222 /DNA_END=938 /DNA_ORIENTATION=+